MNGSNSSFSDDELNQSSSFPLQLVIFLTCMILYLCTWVVCSIYKYWGKMEPGHIFLINILLDNVLILLGTLCIQLNILFSGSPRICTILHFLDNWMKVARFLGLILSEVNRFLALYWNIHYKDRVTNDTAWIAIVALKLISLVITLLYALAFVSPGCPDTKCMSLQKNDYSPLTMIIQTNYGVSTVGICLYVFSIARKHQNAVVPINLNNLNGDNQNEQQEEDTSESLVVNLVKTAMKVNKLSFCQLGLSAPLYLVRIIVFTSGAECGEYSWIKLVTLFDVIGLLIIMPIIIYQKMKHIV